MTSCWIVTETGLKGTENQCIGVAEALGITPVKKSITLRQPWKSLSPWLGFETAFTFDGAPLSPPWPDLVIASGRKSIAAARYIKKKSGGKSFTVFIQDPKISARHFDLVAVPFHDKLRGENVIVTDATPNRVTSQKLAKAREDFAPRLVAVKKPRVAVLIGGNSRTHTMTAENMTHLAGQLSRLADEQNMGLMITASRRTGEENMAILTRALESTDALLWDGAGENPYFGFLAYADYILVTADSASMISEAGTTGKPVYIAPLEGGSDRFERLYNHLISKGIVREFTGILETYGYTPLNDATLVAEEIKNRMPATKEQR